MRNPAAAAVAAAEELADEEKALQIPIPQLILAVAVGMWFFNNQGTTPAEAGSSSNPSATQNDPSNLPEYLQDAVFSLAITEATDFEALAE